MTRGRQGERLRVPDRIRPVLTPARKTTSQDLYQGFGQAWSAVSTLLAGIIVWGAAGWGLDHLFGTRPILLITGVLVGNFGAIYLLYIRMVRDLAAENGEVRRAA